MTTRRNPDQALEYFFPCTTPRRYADDVEAYHYTISFLLRFF